MVFQSYLPLLCPLLRSCKSRHSHKIFLKPSPAQGNWASSPEVVPTYGLKCFLASLSIQSSVREAVTGNLSGILCINLFRHWFSSRSFQSYCKTTLQSLPPLEYWNSWKICMWPSDPLKVPYLNFKMRLTCDYYILNRNSGSGNAWECSLLLFLFSSISAPKNSLT